MDSVLLAARTEDLVRELLDVVELLEAILEADDLLVDVLLEVVDRGMPHYFVGSGAVLLFDHVRVPFDCQVAPFEEVFDRNSLGRLNHAATAFLDPIALRARVALPVDGLQHEGLEAFLVSGGTHTLLPIGLIPPEVVVRQELAVLLEDIVRYCPHLFVDSSSGRLSW